MLLSLLACSATSDDTAAEPVHIEIPEHNECLPVGEEMSEEVCIALVKEDDRFPGTSQNKSGIESSDDDPRLTDPDYLWLESEIRRCACVCCHTTSYGGPGTYFWDMEFEPVWIDSASGWSLSVLGGWTDNELRTLPSYDMERVQAVIERELDLRREND